MSFFRRAVEVVESGERKQQILQPVQTGTKHFSRMKSYILAAIPKNTILCSMANII